MFLYLMASGRPTDRGRCCNPLAYATPGAASKPAADGERQQGAIARGAGGTACTRRTERAPFRCRIAGPCQSVDGQGPATSDGNPFVGVHTQ